MRTPEGAILKRMSSFSRHDQLEEIEKVFGVANVDAKKASFGFAESDPLILAAQPHVYDRATKLRDRYKVFEQIRER